MKSSIKCVNIPVMRRIGILVWRFLSKFVDDVICVEEKCRFPRVLFQVDVIDCGVIGHGYSANIITTLLA